MKNIVVLISGGGTNLQALLDAVAEERLLARISGVIRSTKHAYGPVSYKHLDVYKRQVVVATVTPFRYGCPHKIP